MNFRTITNIVKYRRFAFDNPCIIKHKENAIEGYINNKDLLNLPEFTS